MASRSTASDRTAGADRAVGDELIREAETAESGTIRNLFDLRMIIGGLFLLYGAYLTIRGLTDSSAAIAQAAGVRINLWTGLGALAVGGAFALWAVLRPLRLEEIAESQAAEDGEPRFRREDAHA